MEIGLLGHKIGMTSVFNEDGCATPVTVIDVSPNRVSQIKSIEADGYSAIQLTAGNKKASRVNKALTGHFAKAEVYAGNQLKEFRVDSTSDYKLGQDINFEDVFKVGSLVDVTAISKGKGFTGVIKRYNFSMQDATHGNSLSHRAPGSIGQNQTPGRVFKGKKMCGQHGNKQCTVQMLEIIKIDAEKNIVMIKGGIPGFPGTKVKIKSSVKAIKRSR